MSIPDNFIYFGLFITDKDKDTLKDYVIDKFNYILSKHDYKLYLNHVTLLHKNDKRSDKFKLMMYRLLNLIFEDFIGEIYKVTITHYGYNNRVFAFKVELPDSFPYFMFKTYHITIATFNGAKSVEANNIINWHELDVPIGVNTILKKIYNENI